MVVTSEGIEYGMPVIKGKIRNLQVRITKSSFKIEGSIHVFCKGNNLEPMTFKEFVQSIDHLQSIIKLPIDDARVARLDFSGNMILKHSVEAYLSYFGDKSRYKKQIMNNGIMYSTEEKVLVFYNKIKSPKNKKGEIPEYWLNKNVLRFEIRFLRKLGKSFNVSELTVKKLQDPKFFNQLCHLWRQEFKSIAMHMETHIGLNPTGSKTKLLEQLSIKQIQQIGYDNFLNEITSWQLAGKINKKEAYDFRKFVKQNASEKYPLAENELIQELNQKIKVAARFEV